MRWRFRSLSHDTSWIGDHVKNHTICTYDKYAYMQPCLVSSPCSVCVKNYQVTPQAAVIAQNGHTC